MISKMRKSNSSRLKKCLRKGLVFLNRHDEDYDAFETPKLMKGMVNALLIELYVVGIIGVIVALF